LNASTHQQLVEVTLGPFNTAADACEYCFTSFTKSGDPPAGPVAPFCICMAYPGGGGHEMFCATPPSAAGYIADKGGCRCKPKDMEAMGADMVDLDMNAVLSRHMKGMIPR